MKLEALRRFALTLPEATEEPHFDKSSFRVGGKIFVTVPPPGTHIHVLIGDAGREPALALHPDAIEKLIWGGKVVGLRVLLAKCPAEDLKALVRAAWTQRAPARLKRTSAGVFVGALLALLALVCAVAPAARAEEPIEELVVAGEQPGPGLWQVRHGDHTLWILGTVTPMPSKLQWRSKEVEQRIAQSQVYLADVDIESDIGMFKAVRLIPAALRARKLPKGERLNAVLEPALYSRWHVLQQRFLPKDDLEGFRPLFAIYPIYARVLKSAGLEESGEVAEATYRLAKKANVPVRTPEVTISVDDPRALLREYTESSPGVEFTCFERMTVRIERDVPALQQRAEAWAKGDIGTLRRLAQELTANECLNFLSALPRISTKLNEVLDRARQEWLLAAEGALLRSEHSFATLPMDELLREDGRLARLKARGYEIVEPQ